MNEYNIIFSMFKLVGENKISTKEHFSNCRGTIRGNTFREAYDSFIEEKRNEGWYAVGIRDIWKGEE